MFADNQKLINTFKSGIVPEQHLDLILSGRDQEIKEIGRCFENTKNNIGSIKFITGPYGSGKTFLLNYAKNMALDLGFVVAKIEVDASFKFYNIEQLYYHVMHNLYVYTDTYNKTSFENIFDLWIQKLKSVNFKSQASKEIQYVISEIGKYNQSFARAFLDYIKGKISQNHELTDLIVSWLTGESNIPFQLKEKFNIKGKIDKSNSIDFLKSFTKLITLLGYNGLVIMIDEMDLILSERSDIRLKSYHNLRYLIDQTIGGHIPNTCFLFSGSDVLFADEEKGLRSYDALSQRLGQAVDSSMDTLLDIRQPVMYLKRLDFEVYGELAEKLTRLYKKVFDLKLSISTDSLKNWVFLTYKEQGKEYSNITMREFITKYIELMDIIHQNPDDHMFKADLHAELQRNKLVFKSKLNFPK